MLVFTQQKYDNVLTFLSLQSSLAAALGCYWILAQDFQSIKRLKTGKHFLKKLGLRKSTAGVFGLLQGDPLINLRSKEQEAELVRQTLAALTAMRIRFPGKSEEEAESVLDEVSAVVSRFFPRITGVVPQYCKLDRFQSKTWN